MVSTCTAITLPPQYQTQRPTTKSAQTALLCASICTAGRITAGTFSTLSAFLHTRRCSQHFLNTKDSHF